MQNINFVDIVSPRYLKPDCPLSPIPGYLKSVSTGGKAAEEMKSVSIESEDLMYLQ